MTGLGELASLRIDREQPARSPWRRKALLFVPVVLLLAALYALRIRQAIGMPGVQTVRAQVTQAGASSVGLGDPHGVGLRGGAAWAVVSAKIQGRLSELRVEEAAKVRGGRGDRALRASTTRRRCSGAGRRSSARRRTWPSAPPDARGREPARGRACSRATSSRPRRVA